MNNYNIINNNNDIIKIIIYALASFSDLMSASEVLPNERETKTFSLCVYKRERGREREEERAR